MLETQEVKHTLCMLYCILFVNAYFICEILFENRLIVVMMFHHRILPLQILMQFTLKS